MKTLVTAASPPPRSSPAPRRRPRASPLADDDAQPRRAGLGGGHRVAIAGGGFRHEIPGGGALSARAAEGGIAAELPEGMTPETAPDWLRARWRRALPSAGACRSPAPGSRCTATSGGWENSRFPCHSPCTA